MKLLRVLLLPTLLWSGCDIVNPDEEMPAYIHIEPFEFSASISTQGSASAKITEAWVTVGGEFLGVYSLPATLPVLAEGVTEVKVEPGIKDNGVSATPEIYPFYESYITSVDLKPTVTDSIAPSTTYKSDARFAFIEGFETTNNIFADDIDGNPQTEVISAFSDAFEGEGVGRIVLTPENPVLQVATNFDEKFSGLQERGIFVYLEMNYKSDTEVAWGVVAYPEGLFTPPDIIYDPIFVARDEWNKIYFNLSRLFFESQAEEFQITFLAQADAGLGETVILLDNVKLVHF